jgi:hydrogenase expression/formation protein HypC
MCIGIPMRVLESSPFSALCEGRGETRRLDMLLVGEQAPGTWVLAFIDQARQVLEPDAVGPINEALDVLEAVINGSPDIEERLANLTAPARPQP